MRASNLRYQRVIVRLYTVSERLMLTFFVVFVFLLFSPVFAYANPLIGMRGKVYLVKYGVPYNKPVKLTVSCHSPYSSHSFSKTCLNYECSIGGWPSGTPWFYSGGPCDLKVETVDGQSFTFDEFIPRELSEVDATQFVMEVDIGTQQIRVNNNFRYDIKVPNSSAALFWVALPLTVVVEAFALLIATRYWLKLNHLGVKRILIVGGLPSLITLPCVWFMLPKVWGVLWGVFGMSYSFYVGIAEALVIVVEAGIYRRLLAVGIKLALLLSFITNVLSFLVGLLVF